MALSPIAFIAPNYRDFSTYWLKAYEPGTTTPKSMALDSAGVVTVAKLELNADGFLESAGGALVIPYIDGAYDAWLFPTEALADANDTTNAEQVADDITGVNGLLAVNAAISSTLAVEKSNVNILTGTTFIFSDRASGIFDTITGTGSANGFDIISHDSLDLSFQLRDSETVNANAFGASPSETASFNAGAISAAHIKADNLKVPVTYAAGEYQSTNFSKPATLVFEGQGAQWNVNAELIGIPFNAQTNGEYTIYVSPTGSDTSNNGLSSSSPYESIQAAIDSIPVNVNHRVTIQLEDGIHTAGSRDTNPISGASTVRTVRVLVDNKNVNGRDMIVIQGNTVDNSLTTIQHNDVYSAVYVEETNGVVIKDLTVDCSLNPGAIVSIFQHRRGDMRIVEVALDGNDFDGSHAILAETGGFIEHAGAIVMNQYERGMVALDAVISFIGDSITHDGGAASASRTFEAGNNGQIDVFSGSLTVTNVQRLVFAKDARMLLSPASSTVQATGFILDADATAQIEARRIIATGGARAVSCAGGHVLINLCTFTDQTTSAVVGTNGSQITIDDCSLIDTTITKSLVDVESCTVTILGDGDIQGGFRGVFAKNSIIQVDEQMNFLGNGIAIDARECKLRLEGTSGNPITMGTYTTNALFLVGTDCFMNYVTVTQPASKTAVLAQSSSIYNGGGVDIDGGFRGFDLSQNSSLIAESTTGSDLTNMNEGANMRRGSQMHYRSSSMDFTGTGTPTVDSASEFSLVTSF